MNALNKVIIFGANSAIATEVARQLAARGSQLFCVARGGPKLDDLLADLRVRAGDDALVHGASADLADLQSHEAVWADAQATMGGVDAVLLAYGNLPDQQRCENDVAAMCDAIHLNAVSAVALLTIIARDMEEQGSGVIAAISSVAGDRGRQSNYIYGAAKGMLTLFMQGLRNRLAKKGIDVVTIKPGFVDTPMTAAFDKKGPLWASAEVVARGIVQAMEKGKGEIYLPWFWRYIMLIIRHIPEFIFKRMSL